MDPFCQREGVVDETVHTAVLRDDAFGKRFQNGRIGNISDEVIAGEFIDDAAGCSVFCKLFCDGFADAFGAAGDHDDFILKHGIFPFG